MPLCSSTCCTLLKALEAAPTPAGDRADGRSFSSTEDSAQTCAHSRAQSGAQPRVFTLSRAFDGALVSNFVAVDVDLYNLGAEVGAAAMAQNDAVEAQQNLGRTLEVTGLAHRTHRAMNGVLSVRSSRVPSGTGSTCSWAKLNEAAISNASAAKRQRRCTFGTGELLDGFVLAQLRILQELRRNPEAVTEIAISSRHIP